MVVPVSTHACVKKQKTSFKRAPNPEHIKLGQK